MTRDYNKQRDNARPFSRNQSPNRPGAERFPRQDRPRLNRETVDRAWESGAPNRHADYRPRSSSQPPRNRWNNNQPSEHAQYGRRPSGNRQNDDRSFERTPNTNAGPRSRSFDPNRRNFDDRRGHQGHQGYPESPNRNGGRQGPRDNSRHYEQSSQFRDNDQGRGYQRPGSRRFEQQPRDFNPNYRSPRNGSQGNFKRDNRSPRNSGGPNRSPYGTRRPDEEHPRLRSRPQAQRGNSFEDQEHFNEREPENEQFEGDYERFDGPRQPKRPKVQPYERERSKATERHVTRLADGRVLKGSRPAQRKNAQFWTGIGDEAENLIDQVHSDSPSTGKQVDQRSEEALSGTPAQGKGKQKAQRAPRAQRVQKGQRAQGAQGAKSKPRARASSAVKRERKSGAKKAVGTSSTVPRPSQRGFQWPSP